MTQSGSASTCYRTRCHPVIGGNADRAGGVIKIEEYVAKVAAGEG